MKRKFKFKVFKDNIGQSTIEYIVTFTFVLGIFITFIRLGINMSAGFLAHYATFMASRSYLVMDNNSNVPINSDGDAEEIARSVFESMKVFNFGIKRGKSSLTFNNPSEFPAKKIEYVGARFDFTLPMTGYQVLGGKQVLNLTSESFLGREPVQSDCYSRVCQAVSDINSKASTGCEIQVTLYDNGC